MTADASTPERLGDSPPGCSGGEFCFRPGARRGTDRVMGRTISRGRRVLWLSLAVSVGIHAVAARLGFMPSLLSLFGRTAREQETRTPQGMEVLSLASPRPSMPSPTLPPDYVPDEVGEEIADEQVLSSPGLDPGTGTGRREASGTGSLSRAPVPLTVPWLRYPPDAIRDRISGVVVLRVRVGPDGRVIGVEVLESLRPDCDRAAVEAARHMVFEPAREGGRDVAGSTDVEIAFDLGKS